MTVTPSIIQHEFIGLEVKVIKSSKPDIVGITGKVVDETRNTFKISNCHGKKKVVIKDISIFEFVMQDGTVVEIDGKVIMGRPEDRLKKRHRRLW